MKGIDTFKRLALGLILVFAFALSEYIAQGDFNTTGSDVKPWRHQKKYDRITSISLFDKSMTDDEMAGIYLWRGGRNLKLAFAFEIVGVVVASTASWLPSVASGKNGSVDASTISLIIGAFGTGFFVAGLCELVAGYNKIGKAGIILQHNRFKVKTTGTSVSLNF